VVVSKRLLKPDDLELLEETRDYVFYPVLVPTPAPAVASMASTSILPEQAANRRSSTLPPPAHAATHGSSATLSPPAQSGAGGSSSAPKGKSTEASAKSSPLPQTRSPVDPPRSAQRLIVPGASLSDRREGNWPKP
jgi:hypothetical protein